MFRADRAQDEERQTANCIVIHPGPNMFQASEAKHKQVSDTCSGNKDTFKPGPLPSLVTVSRVLAGQWWFSLLTWASRLSSYRAAFLNQPPPKHPIAIHHDVSVWTSSLINLQPISAKPRGSSNWAFLYVATLYIFLRLNDLFLSHNAVLMLCLGLSTKKHLVRVRKTSCVDLKYLSLLPYIQLEIVLRSP